MQLTRKEAIMSTPQIGSLNGQNFPSSPSAKGKVVKATEVEDLIHKAFGGKFFANNIVRLGDENYYLPTKEEVKQVLNTSTLDASQRQWVAERYDCDDFSYVLKGAFSTAAYLANDIIHGFAVGIIWANFNHLNGFHAINLVVTDDEVVHLIEPQGNFFYPAANCRDSITIIVM
jgi:hypothetical protein